MSRSPLVLLAALTLASACGGESPPPASPPPGGSSSASPAALPSAWQAGMTKDQQMAFMKERVVPPLAKVFQAHDAKEFASFGCVTCHGPKYQEPKDFLPRLTMKDGKITSFAEKPAVSQFMAEKVVPAMAAAMGLPPYDPATHKGFGCAGCHAIDAK